MHLPTNAFHLKNLLCRWRSLLKRLITTCKTKLLKRNNWLCRLKWNWGPNWTRLWSQVQEPYIFFQWATVRESQIAAPVMITGMQRSLSQVVLDQKERQRPFNGEKTHRQGMEKPLNVLVDEHVALVLYISRFLVWPGFKSHKHSFWQPLNVFQSRSV